MSITINRKIFVDKSDLSDSLKECIREYDLSIPLTFQSLMNPRQKKLNILIQNLVFLFKSPPIYIGLRICQLVINIFSQFAQSGAISLLDRSTEHFIKNLKKIDRRRGPQLLIVQRIIKNKNHVVYSDVTSFKYIESHPHILPSLPCFIKKLEASNCEIKSKIKNMNLQMIGKTKLKFKVCIYYGLWDCATFKISSLMTYAFPIGFIGSSTLATINEYTNIQNIPKFFKLSFC